MDLPAEPVSDFYGYDRGTPIDRHHIEAFLGQNAHRITGHVAEVKDDTYTRRFGTGRPHTTTVIDIDLGNPHATLIADLTQPASLPAATFDCVICTQTLQFLPDLAAALNNVRRALRPGGTLLLTAPALSRISCGNPESDLWRLTPAGLRRLLADWPGPVTITGPGNLPTYLAFLTGYAAEELAPGHLDAPTDPRFPLLACAAASLPTP